MPHNMSYIQFENTVGALKECLQSLQNRTKLSDLERKYALEMFQLCEEVLDNEEDFEESQKNATDEDEESEEDWDLEDNEGHYDPLDDDN